MWMRKGLRVAKTLLSKKVGEPIKIVIKINHEALVTKTVMLTQ